MSLRTAAAGLPRDTAAFLQRRPKPGDLAVCFDEYAGYFARRYEVRAYGSVDDRAEELPRLLAAVTPLLGREEDLWVQCSPSRKVARAEGTALAELGFTLTGFSDERRGVRKSGTGVVIGQAAFDASARESALARAAEAITPNGRPFGELEGYLAERWGGVSHRCFPHERDGFLGQVLLDQWFREGRDTADVWLSDAVQWRYEHPGEAGDWDLRCVKLTGLRRPRPERRASSGVYSYAPEEIILQFELSRGALSSISGPVDRAELERFGEELVLWLGVTGEDIRTRSPRFQAYVSALEVRGGFVREGKHTILP